MLAPGARAAEAALLARLDALAGAARREPALLALPVRVIVPSRSLRRHIAARLVQPRAGGAAAAAGQPRPFGAMGGAAPVGAVGTAGGATAVHGVGSALRPAVAGVVVQTLYGVACEAIERSGRPAPRGVHLFETLVERAARREPILRRGLGDLVDGFLSVAVVIADLLDAGFEPVHAEALDEVLASDGVRQCGRAQAERARALVRVAVQTELRLRDAGLGRRSTLLREAADALASAPDLALPSRCVLLHGFISPTGVAADLLAILCRRPATLLIADQPPRPTAGTGTPAGGGSAAGTPAAGPEPILETAATFRLVERLGGLLPKLPAGAGAGIGPGTGAAAGASAEPGAGVGAEPGAGAGGEPGSAVGGAGAAGVPAVASGAAAPPAILEAFTAVGVEAEVRQVACRLRLLLDGPPAAWPEGLAVVARDLGPYRVALRRHLRRLGVPFSGIGEPGGLLAAGRRAAAALDLLRLGAEAPADRWLDACANLPAPLRVDLSLALRALGAARLRDVAALREQAFPRGMALPIRHGLQSAASAGRPGDPAAGWGAPIPPRHAGRDADPADASPVDAGPAGASPVDAGPAGAAGAQPGHRPYGIGAATPANGRGDPGGAATPVGRQDGAAGGGAPASGQGDPGGLEAPASGQSEAPLDDDGEGRAVARARRIAGPELRLGVQSAVRLHDLLAARPREAAAGRQFAWLRRLLGELGLGEAGQPLAAALAQLEDEVPAAVTLSAEEVRLLLGRALGDRGQSPLGGAGGGVQVLSVAEARGRTFERLFVLGLNRDQFPRPVREDPLLGDEVRQVLRRVLPDLPLARDAFDDERHAFAQLLSAAPAVCLSWRTGDDDGRPLQASPLVERLLPALSPWTAPAVYAPPRQTAAAPEPPPRGPARARELDAPPSPALGGRRGSEPAAPARPADEHAVLAGLYGERRDLALVMPLAVAQVRAGLGRALVELDPAAVAAGRMRVLDEQDPDLRTAAGRAAAGRLGPYFGFVGARRQRPGHALYITHLEALAACPWQLFLGRVLRLERPPDPLAALPGADPLRLGNLVHRALDRLLRRALAASSPDSAPASPAAAAAPPPVRWPAAAEVAAALDATAAELLAEEGLALPGWAAALAAHARPFVEAAQQVDWPPAETPAAVGVVANEVTEDLVVERPHGAPALRIRCRADREDRVGGRRRFTDYKTGKPLSEARDAGRRRARLLAEIRTGSRLQAVAYLIAAGGQAAEGRYLFLRPDLADPGMRQAAVETGDGAALAAWEAAMAVLLDAWDAGSFFPRLLDPAGRKEPPRCQFCAVAEACLRSDPAARSRLLRWTAGEHAPPTTAAAAAPPHAAEAALAALWELPRAAGPGGDEAETP